ncbi:MAG: hypothetical protein ACYDCC_10215 [Actinomycetota bacterium]
MRRRAFAYCLLVATIFVAFPSAAQPATSSSDLASRVGVDTALVEVKASPGTSAGDSVTLTNKTSSSIVLQAFINDVGTNADGDIVAVSRGQSDQSSASAWINLKTQTITLPPSGSATVGIVVSIPKGTPPRGYYSAITFDTSPSSSPETRLIHAILVNVVGPGSAVQPRLVSVSMPLVSLNGKFSITIDVQNLGNVHAIGSGTVEIKNFGVHVDTLTLPPIVVLPNVHRVVHVSLPNPPIAGRLTAAAKIDFSNGDHDSLASSAYVIIWWFAIMLLVVLLLFAAAMLRLVGVTGPRAKRRREARKSEVAEEAPEQELPTPRKAQRKAPPPARPIPAPPPAPSPPPPPLERPREPVAASVMRPDTDTPFWDEHGPELAPFAKVEHDETPEIIELDPSEQTRETATSALEEDEELTSSWVQPAPPSRPIPVRPVPVVKREAPSSDEPIVARAIELPPEEELRPAGAPRMSIRVANLPPVPNAQPLPESPWSPPPPETTLDRPKAGGAMALRRAEVALRMITGKTGETGAILDAGLDLLYSVRSDRAVVEHIENEFTATRNRRRLGPLALALFAVDSMIAPEALLDAYASATKVVAERIRRAILACDPADVRRHRDLIAALPPARKDSIGL